MNRSARLAVPALLALTLGACVRGTTEEGPPPGVAVRLETIRAAPFQATLTLLGTVRPSDSVPLTAGKGGIVSYPARFAGGLRTGEPVAGGEPLATFENDDARLRLAEARLGAELTAAELARSRRGYDQGIVPEVDLSQKEISARLAKERLVAAEREAKRLTVSAPRAGRLVVTKLFPPGSDVPAGTSLGEVAGNGRPTVEAWAAAADRERLKPSLAARFLIPGKPVAVAEGSLREVASVVEASGTVKVVAEVKDARRLPAPGEGVELIVELPRRLDALTVPDEALSIGSGGTAVFVSDRSAGWGSLLVKRVPVETGGRGSGRTEVLRGLSDGDRVVVSGVALLTDGARVVVAAPPTETPAKGTQPAERPAPATSPAASPSRAPR